MKKDDLIELTIEDLGVDGEGIGKVDGMAIFVKDAVPGDRVQAKVMKMKKSYGYARLMQVLDPSPERMEPRCAFARQCGGCQLQAMTYEPCGASTRQRSRKEKRRCSKCSSKIRSAICGTAFWGVKPRKSAVWVRSAP